MAYATLVRTKNVVAQPGGGEPVEGVVNTTDSESIQARKFKELAQQLECDEDETHFEETVKKVAKSPPPAPEKSE